jgi:GMP synthase (glutamine-hydrolysing)
MENVPKIRVHGLEHGPTEGVARIGDWARSRGHQLAISRLDLGQDLPRPEEFDLLVVMGGGMNIYQYRDFPWLRKERELIVRSIETGKAIFGVCLGAQLLADALGARVHQNAEKEIGWLPVRFIDRPYGFDRFPTEATVFHWHGDTFEIPRGSRRIAESDGCLNQGFVQGDRLVGLQFHIEVAADAIADFIAGGESEMRPARFVQSVDEILRAKPDLQQTDAALVSMLDSLAAKMS